MDTLSHSLWVIIAARVYNQKNSRNNKPKETKKINLWHAWFWGLFPDLFAFSLLFAWRIGLMITGSPIPSFHNFESQKATVPMFQITSFLYNTSHSLIVFCFVAIIVWFIFRRLLNKGFPLAILGWPIHVLMDIPTHSFKFYPTPFLWPLSDWRFDGFVWGQIWFIVLNWTLLLSVFVYLHFTSVKRIKQKK